MVTLLLSVLPIILLKMVMDRIFNGNSKEHYRSSVERFLEAGRYEYANR